MKTRIGWQRVGPIACEQICWPVKIRVRAKPPLLAPRLPPVFPASPLGYRPDVVLLDVCLPDRNGFDVLQCFKQAAPGCAVILLSDAPDPCVEEVSHLLGATEVCHKARELNRIREVLRRIVREQSVIPA